MGGDQYPVPVSEEDSGTFMGWVGDLVRQGRLAWRLFWDRRVSFWTKLVPPAALIYVLSPIDILPDWPVMGLNQLDDVAVLLLGIKLFIHLAPADIVREHLMELGARLKEWRVVEEEGESSVIEGEYEVREPAELEVDVEDAEVVEPEAEAVEVEGEAEEV